MKKLSVEEVKHVAHLARIQVSDEEIESYRTRLGALYEMVDGIHEIEGYSEEMMITPVEEVCSLRKDEVGAMLDGASVLSNAPKTNGKFIEVPVVINE